MKEKYWKLLKNINRTLQAFIIILTLFSFLFVSLSTAYSSHISFNDKKRIYWVDSIIYSVYQIKWHDLFLTYTGLNTGYGFFSPNVKSDIIIINTFYKNGEMSINRHDEYLKTREGRIRFRGVNDIFMDKVTIEEEKLKQRDTLLIRNSYRNQMDSLKIEYFKVVLKQMNRHYLKDKIDKYDSINTKVYLYHFPFLRDYPNMQHKLYEIENVTVLK